MGKINYRCTFIRDGIQCLRIASRKIKDKGWLCLEHTNEPQLVTIRISKGSGKNATPEERKLYNRTYRKEYRKTHPRKDHLKWPIRLDWYYYSLNGTVWRYEASTANDEAFYHCEICCQQIKVRRIANYSSPSRSFRVKAAVFYVGTRSFKVLFDEHVCVPFPQKRVVFIHCERCGALGTAKHTIKSTRIFSGPYDDKLCYDCWRIMRPMWELYYQIQDLIKVLSEFRSVMREMGMSINHRMPDRDWYYERIVGYDDSWWIKDNPPDRTYTIY